MLGHLGDRLVEAAAVTDEGLHAGDQSEPEDTFKARADPPRNEKHVSFDVAEGNIISRAGMQPGDEMRPC